jgi:non-homologous end joining protein Ku
MAGARAAWRGAIEVNGFAVNVALYSRVKKQRNESFRLIGPSGQPIKSNWPLDSATGEAFDPDLTRRAVEVGRGKDKVFVPMTEEAIEQINSGVKTEIARADRYVPVAEIDMALAIDRFVVRGDDKVPGSGSSVNVLWNGLRGSALYADEVDFRAVLLPFEAELYPVPAPEFERDDKAADLFQQVLGDELVGRFEHGHYVSEYRARRHAAIQAVIDGADIPEPEPVLVAGEVPDLMAVLTKAVEEKQKPKAKRTRAQSKTVA